MPARGEMPTQVWGGGDGVELAQVFGLPGAESNTDATIENGASLAYVKVQKGIWSLSPGYSRGSHMSAGLLLMTSIAQLCRFLLCVGSLLRQASS